MIETSRSVHRDPRRRRDEVIFPIVGGLSVAVAGSVIGDALDWAPPAFWGVLVVAGFVGTLLMARGALIHVPRREPRTRPERGPSFSVGVAMPEHEDSAVGGLRPRKVLALAGPSASSKSWIAEYIVNHHEGWARASCGAFVKSVARERGIPVGDLARTHDLGQHLVEEMGGRAFLDAVIAHANLGERAIDTLVIDDIYHLEVFDALKERWRGLQFVAIDLPAVMRRRLMENRGVPPEKVEAVEHSKLDHAAMELLKVHGSEVVHLKGAVSEDEVPERSRELFDLVAA